MKAITRRVGRLDGGDLATTPIEQLTDAQLWRVIAKGMPDPERFLERVGSMADLEIDQLLAQIIEQEKARVCTQSA